jgi:hypothetical protein
MEVVWHKSFYANNHMIYSDGRRDICSREIYKDSLPRRQKIMDNAKTFSSSSKKKKMKMLILSLLWSYLSA